MNYAFLLAGGTGRRITSTKMPKQFVRAGGKMMVTCRISYAGLKDWQNRH